MLTALTVGCGLAVIAGAVSVIRAYRRNLRILHDLQEINDGLARAVDQLHAAYVRLRETHEHMTHDQDN